MTERTRIRVPDRGRDLLPAPPPWTRKALCHQVGTPADWEPDPDDAAAVQDALWACEHCTVRSRCLQEALTAPPSHQVGVRGGLTAQERTRLQRRQRRARASD
ncbi:WhiB family transcriptional regulator [Nocardiopsis sp. NPDC006198]|uniref:WhiB family transcriptional regulator n=1 Tax=Nocardiopsis sp. NPDC006198 TaxID=3154472 RepID=UPI0033BF5A04